MKFKRNIIVLTSFLLITSCNNGRIPTNYNFDNLITNENGGVYYEIFVRSFADSDNDGIGDLEGIRQKLPYLEDLGVKGLWLTPIHPSPSYHGYDVEDYTAINQDFGTHDDFEALISDASAKNIDVIIDLVLNHSSSTHPWYIEGKERFQNGTYDKNDPHDKANWYNFRMENGKAVAEATFGDWMPDLNLNNIEVRNEITRFTHFWLDKGVKGFRLDAVSHFLDSVGENVEFLGWFRDMVNTKKPDSYIVAEAFITSFSAQKHYYHGVDSLFNFAGANLGGFFIDSITSNTVGPIGLRLAEQYTAMRAINEDAILANFLTNHDMDRSSGMFLLEQAGRQKVAASIYLLTPGYPFMYYGEEIGLKGSRGSAQTDADRRLPMIWQKEDDVMRTNNPPGVTYDLTKQVRDGVRELSEQPFSLLNHYKKVINVRNAYEWLTYADFENYMLPSNYVSLYKLSARDDSSKYIYVAHNIYKEAQTLDLSRFVLNELEIIDDIYTNQVRSVIKNNTLTIEPYSSVILSEV